MDRRYKRGGHQDEEENFEHGIVRDDGAVGVAAVGVFDGGGGRGVVHVHGGVHRGRDERGVPGVLGRGRDGGAVRPAQS